MTKYPMLLLSMYLLLCLPAVWMPAAAGAPPVHPRCQRRCGDVYVPYLFGIGDHCALHNVFNISSEVVNGTARPFAGPFEVTKISVADAKAWIKVNISWECYDPASRQKRRSRFREGFGYSTAPFRFSYEDDKIFVIGCNTVATIRAPASVARPHALKAKNPKTVCALALAAVSWMYQKSWRLVLLTSTLSMTLPKYGNVWKRSPCSYMVVMEKSLFSYNSTYSSSTTFWDSYSGQVPFVTDWAIRPYTCKDAIRNNLSSYACISENGGCVDSTNGQGYRCKCLDGYEGNPYLKDGCKDIDELEKWPMQIAWLDLLQYFFYNPFNLKYKYLYILHVGFSTLHL